MPQSQDNQQKAFAFLSEHCTSQAPFSRAEFKAATGFTEASFNTYLSKQFKPLLVPCPGNCFRVHLVFRQFNTWPKFRDLVVSQNRKLTRKYRSECHQYVLLFDFFMPLRNEEWLKSALDSLFFKDAITSRLKAIDATELRKRFSHADEAEEQYLHHICNWISDTFGGYSINHVSGRFKVGQLKNRREVVEGEAAGTNRYLVDETTAVVRFIFPCGSEGDSQKAERRAEQIRWFFDKLFVETILEMVSGEDEVWLLESGMRHQLHIFKAED
jgi:hypothetical protein